MNNLKDLYIIGAGGFGREVAWLVERINAQKPTWDIKGILDDNTSLHGTELNGHTVIGGCDYLKNVAKDAWVVCAVGSPKIRRVIIEKIQDYLFVKFATLIDPSVILSDTVTVGEGSIICAGTILTVNINVGRHVIINLQCTLGHDDVIEDFVTIYPGANVSGNVVIGAATEIGTGTKIIQGKSIGVESVLGAGAVVVKDIQCNCTAVGIPANVVKYK